MKPAPAAAASSSQNKAFPHTRLPPAQSQNMPISTKPTGAPIRAQRRRTSSSAASTSSPCARSTPSSSTNRIRRTASGTAGGIARAAAKATKKTMAPVCMSQFQSAAASGPSLISATTRNPMVTTTSALNQYPRTHPTGPDTWPPGTSTRPDGVPVRETVAGAGVTGSGMLG